MIVTTWILFIFFAIVSLHGLLVLLLAGLNWFHAIFWILSIFITSISAGVIWGGLFQ